MQIKPFQLKAGGISILDHEMVISGDNSCSAEHKDSSNHSITAKIQLSAELVLPLAKPVRWLDVTQVSALE